jgi:hypothetical protein
MKAHLLFPDRDLPTGLELGWNEPDLLRDLGLDLILDAMAGEPGADRDARVLETAATLLRHAGQTPPEVMRYRQAALRDAVAQPAAVDELYAIAGDAVRAARQSWMSGLTPRSPSSALYHYRSQLGLALAQLSRLHEWAQRARAGFGSRAFLALCDACRAELTPEYLAVVRGCLEALEFRSGVLAGARLGEHNESAAFVLRAVPPPQGWRERLRGNNVPRATITLHESDEAGARIVGDMRARASSRAAAALAQAARQVMGFFASLHAEAAFYVGAGRLWRRLAAKGEPLCFPQPAAEPGALRCHGLFDIALSLQLPGRAVGNDVAAGGRNLVVITGANRGGKSTFLRSLGQAQWMMQAGLFAGAESYAAGLCPVLATHFRREEDPSRLRGKFEEELQRMSAIIDALAPGAWLLLNEPFAATQESEGAEIAGGVVTALRERRMRIFFVTHMASLAASLYRRRDPAMLFLRAGREADGSRSFRLSEGEPLQTSFGEDLYRRIFAAAAPAEAPAREAEAGVH